MPMVLAASPVDWMDHQRKVGYTQGQLPQQQFSQQQFPQQRLPQQQLPQQQLPHGTFICPGAGCNAVFTSKEEFSSHYLKVHGPKKDTVLERIQTTNVPLETYRCSSCSAVFDTKESHWEHWLAAHSPQSLSAAPAATEDTVREATTSTATEPDKNDNEGHQYQCPIATAAATTTAAATAATATTPTVVTTTTESVSYRCASCPAQFSTKEAHLEHYLAVHSAAPAAAPTAATTTTATTTKAATTAVHSATTPSPEGSPTGATSGASEPETTARRVVKMICPTCGEGFDTNDQAKQHWLDVHGPKAVSSTAPAEEESSAEAASTTQGVATIKAQLIETDENGKPSIVRQKDPSTGVGRTVVINEDGSQKCFGEDTVDSLLAKSEQEVQDWFEYMTEKQLRGLVNEISERMIESSNRLFDLQNELEVKSEQTNLKFFELDQESTKKDLENAYRRLARSMHPDKNGGTKEANERFQAMKTRYEDLKELFAEGKFRSSKGESSVAPSASQDSAPSEKPQQQEKAQQQEEDQKDQDQKQQDQEELGQQKKKKEGQEEQQQQEEQKDDVKNVDTAEKAHENEKVNEDSQEKQTSSGEGQKAPAKEQVLYCRSKDKQVLCKSARSIMQQMKTIRLNLSRVEESIEEFEQKNKY